MQPIYLDHNASTPLIKEVIDVMMPYFHHGFGNPSSSHWYGQESKKSIEKARKQVASLIGCSPEEIIFTSGGSESNNLAIKGIAEQHEYGHIITSSIEYPSVIQVCRYLEKRGYQLSYLPVDKFGILHPETVEEAITPDTILISIMLANNEVGTIEPIKEIAEIAHENEIVIHIDAAQAVGKIHVDVNDLNVDLLSVAGHKMNAPKGIGALYIKTGVNLSPIIHGADHEKGLSAGTENVLAIVGIGVAAESFQKDEKKIINQLRHRRDELWNGLKEQLLDIELNGHPSNRLPNTVNIAFSGIDANTLLSELNDIAASAGAACHADSLKPSAVLTAMGLSKEKILSSVRFSVGRTTTPKEISTAIKKISETVKRLKGNQYPSYKPKEVSSIRLTQFTHGLGCACKIHSGSLKKILDSLNPIKTPKILVGYENSDDAAVYHLNDETAIVSTVDFFTPIVDDPFDFGQIAAANSLSDIYAMGAKPTFALNIVAFPEKRLPLKVLETILAGAQSIAEEAGIPILGGHTIENNEPKFGLAVTGTVHPDNILTNSSAKEGDVLILTKPIGLGILSTALKRGMLGDADKKNISSIMSSLNAKAAEIFSEFPVHACTDITGFGLLGHLYEMTSASSVNAKVFVSKVPVIPETREMMQLGSIPGGTESNMEYLKPYTIWDRKISHQSKLIICDAQTSGGLLAAIPENYSEDLINNLHKNGVLEASIIGIITKGQNGKIKIVS